MKKIKQIGILLSLIAIVVLGINYVIYGPTEINAFIASKIYKEGVANPAFDDDNFYKCVVDSYNTTNKTSHPYTYNLSDEELQTITNLRCTYKEIESVKGLEKITSLTSLYLDGNKITNIDISNNTSLMELHITDNYLSKIDVSNNQSLKLLYVAANDLIELDANGAVSLTHIYAHRNQLTTLNLKGATSLKYISVTENQLVTLDISDNVALTQLYVGSNKLTGLDVSNNINLITLDIGKNCAQTSSYMGSCISGNNISSLDVSNNILLQKLGASNNQLTKLDVSKNTELTELYINKNKLTELDVSRNIVLTKLWADNNQLTKLDVSKNTELTELYVYSNKLTELDVAKNISLTKLNVYSNQLTKLDVTKNVALTKLDVYLNQLTELDVSKNVLLTSLWAYENQLTKLDISKNTELTELHASSNQLTELDVTKNASLTSLYISSNQLKKLDLSKNKLLRLSMLKLDNNPFGEVINVYKGTNLIMDDNIKIPSELNLDNPVWSSSDTNIAIVDQNRLVSTLKSGSVDIIGKTSKYIITNKINIIEITSDKYEINEEENYIYVGLDNDIDTIKENINISHEEISINVDLDSNKLQVKYNEDILKEFTIISVSSEEYDLSNEYILSGGNTDLNKFKVINGNVVVEDNIIKIKYNKYVLQTFYESDFEDQKFYNCVIDSYNSSYTNKLSYKNHISEEQLQKIKKLNCSNYGKNDSEKILSIKGLEKLTNITFIALTHNLLTDIDLSNNVELTDLYLTGNQLSELDLSKNIKLVTLYIGGRGYSSPTDVVETKDGNNITTINLENNVLLKTLSVRNNPLTELDLSKNILLEWVNIQETKVSNLNVSNNINLKSLNISYNNFTDVDISNNHLLEAFVANNNQLKELDVSNNINLKQLWVHDNQLTNIDLTKNVKLEWLYGYNNKLIELDVSKNKVLSLLQIHYNELNSLDLTNNIALNILTISNNKYKENLFVYKGNNAIAGDNVKIPSQLGWNNPTWITKESSIATVDSNGLVSTLKSGTVDISGIVSGKYSTISTINVVEITSDKYGINEEDNYIYVGIDDNIDAIKENINISHEEIDINIDLDDNKLQVRHNEYILKEFKIIRLNSTEYDLTKKYIYTGLNQFDATKVNIVNANKEVKENKLLIKYGEEILQSYDIVGITSETYDLTKNYIYVGEDKSYLDKITITNGTKEAKENKLQLKYKDLILKEYDLVSISSETYDLSNKYILSGGNTDLEKIEVINGNAVLEDNIIKIKYDEYVLQTFYESAFDDINFYKCVIDAYNIKTSDVSYDHHLTDEQLNIITRLSCNGYNKSDDDKIVSTKGLEKLLALTELEVIYHSLTQLDISNNTELTTINLSANKLAELDVSKNKKLEHLGVNSNQLIELDVSGNETLIHLGLNDNQLTELDVSKNTPLKYLYVDNNQLSELEVSNNLELSWLTLESNKITKIDVSKNIALNRLFVTNNQLTELDLRNNTELVDLLMYNNPYNEKLYIYKGNSIKIGNNIKLPNQLNWEKPTWLSKSNSIATVDNNGIITAIKQGKVDVEGTVSGKYTTTSTINVIEITSDKYQINETENYIYVGLDNAVDTIKENINTSHEEIDINVDLDNNKLQVKHNEYILKEFKIIRLSSTEYDLNDEYIYVSNLTNEEILSKVNIINGTKEIDGNKLLIKYNDILLDEYNLVKVISNGMPILDNSKIYISNSSEDKIRKSINVINAEPYIKKEKIEIIRDDTVMGEFDILSLNLGNLKESSKMIVIEDEIEYNNFISNITLTEGLSYKVLNGTNKVTNGNVAEGMKLKIYYKDREVDSFDITEEYVYIDESLDIDENNKYISNIELNAKAEDIINMIDTSGTVTITNNKNEVITGDKLIGTGTKISIKLNTKTIEYQVIIQGDIDGDGKLQLGDIMKLANYLYKDQTSLNDVYLLAADYDRNGTHHLQDIMKIANKIYG